MSSVNLKLLPSLTFAPQSTAEVESAIITAYEKLAGITLQPADPVRLFLESLAYVVSVQNGLIDLAGKQNLLAYATGAHLDHLGALMGVTRIPAQTATTIVRFSINEVLTFAVPIPEGTRVTTQDGSIVFATQADVEIAAGSLYVDVVAQSTVAGEETAGLVAGQINRLVDPLPYITSVANTTTSTDGADIETDERLRERIRIAPESYTVAGSSGAYEARTLEVSAEISAVAVYSPEPGVVDIRFMMEGGELPDETTIAQVHDALSDHSVRPLTDHVLVGAPDIVNYEISGQWFLHKSDVSLFSAINTAVEAAVEEFRIWQRSKPGRDVNPTRFISKIQQAGAKRVELTSPTFTALKPIEVAIETSINFTFGGIEDE